MSEAGQIPELAASRGSHRVAWTLVRLAVGVGLLFYMAHSRLIDFHALGRLLTAWPVTLIAMALIFADIFFMSLRLCWLFRPQGLKLSLRNSLELNLVSSFFATFLPGAAGGDLAKLYYATRENKGRRAEIVTTIAFDRFVGLFSILLLPLLFAPFFVPLIIHGTSVLQVLMATTAALALGASLAANLTMIAAAALAISLLAPGSLSWRMCLVIPMGDVANSLPITPGGLGVGEAAFNGLFRVAGLSGGAEALLCWRIWRAMLSLAGLVVYLRGMQQNMFSTS